MNPDDKADVNVEESISIAAEVFKLLETLCWSVPDDLVSRFV